MKKLVAVLAHLSLLTCSLFFFVLFVDAFWVGFEVLRFQEMQVSLMATTACCCYKYRNSHVTSTLCTSQQFAPTWHTVPSALAGSESGSEAASDLNLGWLAGWLGPA